MQDSNGPSVPSGVPDFNQELMQAKATGDYEFVLETAKRSHRMLVDFRDIVQGASYAGKDASAIALGLNFLANLINNSASQVEGLRRAEKETREALKAALKSKEKSTLEVVDPETPPTPSSAPELPSA